jgi:hypothetical protein
LANSYYFRPAIVAPDKKERGGKEREREKRGERMRTREREKGRQCRTEYVWLYSKKPIFFNYFIYLYIFSVLETS